MRNQTKFFSQTKRNASSVARQAIHLAAILIFVVAPVLPNPVRTVPAGTTSLPAMSQLTIGDMQRMLVIAPHPDDETIAPGGLIQTALANGTQVRVVIVTNGDGQFMAPAIFGLEDALSPDGYIAMGERRQAESLKALEQLGLSEENIIFLGYPDRGIEPMLHENWAEANPYTAPFTRTDHSPYTNSFTPGARYCGSALFADLETILSEFHPDLVVLPHPADQHSDHQAASNFTQLAVAALQADDMAYQPQLWAYLVHYGKYPESQASVSSTGFLPPSDLADGTNSWGSLTLKPDQESTKNTAIRDYPTQTFLLGNFLQGFARPNEIFMLLSTRSSITAMPGMKGMDIPSFTPAGSLPENTSQVCSLQAALLDHFTQFNLKEGICQDPEFGYLRFETILWKRLSVTIFPEATPACPKCWR
jgi:LmbE family N-acetylglucosaminyl deacetylase